jgi:hypothetical protein
MHAARSRYRAGLLALISLLATMAALAVAVSPAAAEIKEEHFCWEANVPATGWCMNTAGVHAYYATEIKATSTNTAFCVLGQFGQQCGAAGQWITINVRSKGQPTYQEPSISNSNGTKATTVKGILISEPPPPPPPPSWHYQEVAGEFLGKPSIARSEEASTSIFVRGLDGNLWQKWTTGVGWSGWNNVSAVTGGPIAGSPGSVGPTSGEVNVVAKLPDNTVGFWTGTTTWGFSGIGGGQILGDPGVALKHVFVRGLDNNLWQKWWTGTYWTEWQNLSGLGGPIASSPSAVSAGPGTLTVVARMPNNHVGVWSWSGTAWSFQELAGEIQGDPGIAAPNYGAVSVFAQGLDGNLWEDSTPGAGWTGWQQITTTPIKSSPSAAGQIGGPHHGEIDVVARSANNQVGVWWYAP